MISSRTLAFLALAASLVPAIIIARGQDMLANRVIGDAAVVDGDSLNVAGVRIRLYGIDAPEHDQTCRYADGTSWSCGVAATAKLLDLVKGQVVVCLRQDTDRYGRMVAICFAGEIDVGAAMVNAGLAVAYRRYSERYLADEQAARVERKGIWNGAFQTPEDFRKGRR